MTAKKSAAAENTDVNDIDTTDSTGSTAEGAAAPAKTPKVRAVKAAAKTAGEEGGAKRGRKPKAATAAAEPKKTEAKKGPGAGEDDAEEDFSDLESDIEGDGDGEAEAETVEAGVEEVAGEDKPKAKPLRMKVSRAKERALMREFGLDETTLTEEEVNKRRQELKTLIKMGKTRGYLTHQEINDHLPEKLVENEILEAIVSMLNDMGIAVYEQAPDAATLLIAGGNTTTATEEEAEEEAEAALSTVDSEFGRTTDPVRMYMREMGTVELLTREGEIEIAKRIEGGLQAMMLAISASPMTIAEILEMANRIRAGGEQISSVVDGFVSDEEADDYVAEEDFDEFDDSDDDDGAG
ncbi:MAG TPA: RNA polymerase sigma factor region1.1 domain-containing protein, partial [Thauera aminoaromatica]|nr:RNA polymerase sigma factor region1.1 domain-containing protein [Thauera aminoaromatica]